MSTPNVDNQCCICLEGFANDAKTIACPKCQDRMLNPDSFSGKMHAACFKQWQPQTCPLCKHKMAEAISDLPLLNEHHPFDGSWSWSWSTLDWEFDPYPEHGNSNFIDPFPPMDPYSFGLYPEEHQPSGTPIVHMSRDYSFSPSSIVSPYMQVSRFDEAVLNPEFSSLASRLMGID